MSTPALHDVGGTSTESHAGSQPAAPGYPALTWHEEPTRAGWWVAWNGWSPTVFFVTDGLKYRAGLFVYHDGFWRTPSEVGAAGWAGPFESPQPSPAATPDNRSRSAHWRRGGA